MVERDVEAEECLDGVGVRVEIWLVVWVVLRMVVRAGRMEGGVWDDAGCWASV